MSLINVSVKHGRTLEDARGRLKLAVEEVRSKFGGMVRQVDWSDEQSRVTILGTGFRVEMNVDDQNVHISADIPILGALMGKSMETNLKQIVQKTFGKGKDPT